MATRWFVPIVDITKWCENMGKNYYAKECSTGCGVLCYYGSTICPDCDFDKGYEDYLATTDDPSNPHPESK